MHRHACCALMFFSSSPPLTCLNRPQIFPHQNLLLRPTSRVMSTSLFVKDKQPASSSVRSPKPSLPTDPPAPLRHSPPSRCGQGGCKSQIAREFPSMDWTWMVLLLGFGNRECLLSLFRSCFCEFYVNVCVGKMHIVERVQVWEMSSFKRLLTQHVLKCERHMLRKTYFTTDNQSQAHTRKQSFSPDPDESKNDHQGQTTNNWHWYHDNHSDAQSFLLLSFSVFSQRQICHCT